MRLPLKVAAATAFMLMGNAETWSQAVIGEIKITARNFCDVGWVPTDGQTINIPSDTRLYSILGNTYGGDGFIDFDVPDFRGRSIVGSADGGPHIGEYGGIEEASLTEAELPEHRHALYASTVNGTESTPTDHELAQFLNGTFTAYHNGPPGNETLSPQVLDEAGYSSSADFGVRQPSLGMHFCMAVDGQYPSRR